MDSSYDEDITQNPFFIELQTEHPELFNRCVAEGWVLCVPRISTIMSQIFTLQDFLGHILISNEELPTTHFMTLTDKTVRVLNRIIWTDQDKNGLSSEIHILFEETFYTSDKVKYKIWCIEFPLELENRLKSHNVITHCRVLNTLRDCIDFLWIESSGKSVLENMDLEIHKLKAELSQLQNSSLYHLKDLMGSLFSNCLQITLKNRRLKEKCGNCRNTMDNLKLAVETYVHHGIYKELFEELSVCTAYEDSVLNKTIRNLADIQLRDLQVKQQFTNCIPVAKRNLSLIQGYSTVLGKVSCIRNTIATINKTHKPDMYVSTDDLLSVLIFLVLKSGIPNWLAHLNFLKHFRFSIIKFPDSDETSFCISTLEAVLEQIKMGLISSSPYPESYSSWSENDDSLCDISEHSNSKESSSNLQHLFEQVKLNHFESVKNILHQNLLLKNSDEVDSKMSINLKNISLDNVLNEDSSEDSSRKMCHPLCTCQRCCRVVSNSLLKSSPTVFSRDGYGFTVLHVAVLYNRVRMIDLILEMNSDVNSTDYSGSTPLHYASAKGYQTAMLLLLYVGADYNKQNMDGNTPLHLACNNGHDSCVKALIYFCEQSDNPLDLQPVNENGDTPLHLASKWGYQSIVRVLLDNGADPCIKNCKGKTPVDHAHSPVTTKLLLSSSPNLFEYVNVSFDLSKKYTELKSSMVLLDLNDDVTTQQKGNSNNISPAVTWEVVKPRNTTDIHNIERLFRAIAFGDVKLACFYMNIDYDLNYNCGVNSNKHSEHKICHPLCACVKCVENKSSDNTDDFNINMCDSKGDTSLHVAVKHNRLEICELLLNNGAIPDIKNNIGRTALHIAAKDNKVEIVEKLLKHFKNTKMTDSIGNTPLHLACKAGSIEAVKLLLKAEPYEAIRNLAHRTPLDEAKDQLHLTIIYMLEETEKNSS